VGDLLALDRVGLQLYLNRDSQTVQNRVLNFYDLLQREKKKVVQHQPKAKKTKGVQNPIPQPDRTSALDVSQPNANTKDSTIEVPEEQIVATETDEEPHPNERILAPINPPPIEDRLLPGKDLPPIHLGEVVRKDKFYVEHRSGRYQELPFTEKGLRRHILIAGSTGSGKTVAARYIIEQAAINGVSSIVIDAQGDISSLVLKTFAEASKLYDHVSTITDPQTTDPRDLRMRIEKHLEEIKKHPGPISKFFSELCLPRIFTPGRPELGLPVSLPPYIDVLAAYGGDSVDELDRTELDDLLFEEVRNLVRAILPLSRVSEQTARGYEELLVRLFRRAHSQSLTLEGRTGIDNLHVLVEQAKELEPDLFLSYLSDRDHQKLVSAIQALQFQREQRWLQGHPLDIAAMCERVNGRTPINILNVQELHNYDERKRVLRQVITAVYKYGAQNPRQSEPPSVVLYIDEIGTGYGERSVGKPDRTATHQVYGVLNRLVRQARKYGVAVMLASQSYTDFQPDLRRQLGTKIIGKVDDRNEQHRVAQSIGDDITEGQTNPREFVEAHLPRLGPPRLLFVSVRGSANLYDQLKCCTLDVVLNARDVRRWRNLYTKNKLAAMTTARDLLESESFAEALAQLDELRHEARFLPALQPQVDALRARCLVQVGRVSEAYDIFTDRSQQNATNEWLDLGRDLASFFSTSGDSTQYINVMKRVIDIASSLDPKLCEKLRLELFKHELFESNDPQAAAQSLESIRTSTNPKLGLYARAWGKALELFRMWLPGWTFFSAKGIEDTKLIEPADAPLSVSVTVLPKEEQDAADPIVYTSDLCTKPDILQISCIADSTGTQQRSFSWNELQAVNSQQHAHIERARANRNAGRIREAIRELEMFFRGPRTAIDTEEIRRYDEDPDIRKTRVDDWIAGLHWRDFECEVAILFTRMGYKAWATSPTGDGGVDVRAIKDDSKVIIQCKHYKTQRVGINYVKALHATKDDEGASHAVLVTSSDLEPGADRWASIHGIEVINGAKLTELFQKYCDPKRPVTTPSKPRPHRNATLFEDYSKPSPQPRRVPRPDLDEKDRSVLELARQKSQIRNKDVQDLLGLSRAASSMRLRKLVDRGYLIMHGSKALAYYTTVGPE